MQTEIDLLMKKVKTLEIGLFSIITILCILLFFSFRTRVDNFNIIRAKGIIIEDSAGRDRILLGAPVPSSPHRVRTDTALVRKHWANTYKDPDQFMKWYKEYYHGAVGMVVMNEDGFDRVQLGDKLSDPNSGKRLFEPAGITWNDHDGWELGGAGVNTTAEGKSRSVIGVDDSNGEAVHIIALEDGTKGIIIGGENGRLMIGMSKKDGAWFQNKEAFTGIKYFNNDGKLIWEQSMKLK